MNNLTTHPPTFAQWVRQLRHRQDWTQEGLAEAAYCSVQTVRAFETGKRRPSVEMARRLAEVLHVPEAQRDTFLRLARALDDGDGDADVAETSAAAALPASPLAEPPRPLPTVNTTLIGREAERNILRQLLLVDRCRLVTLVGAGGMGKTRLALDLAEAGAAAFTHGVAFVALAALQRAQQLPFTLAEALGLPLQEVVDVQQHLLRYLAPRTLLLVLDNFEHLLPDPASIHFLREVLRAAPDVQLLVTSRERLRITGERSFELTGLTLPSSAQATDAADALMLFLERAQQADHAFTLDDGNRAAVIQICTLLGGMPLGIELAAAWVRILSCAEIAAELARNMDFLELADRDASPRHRSMRAVFDHSWHLLSAGEQTLLASLAYFRGGCTRQAAEQVAGATLPVLASLIDKSLLTRAADGRFALHELIRQFANEHLQQRREHCAHLAQRHALYFTALLRRNQPRLEGIEQAAALTEIAADLENLYLAWEWICAERQWAAVEPYVLGLGYYHDICGHHRTNEFLLTQALTAFDPPQSPRQPAALSPLAEQAVAQLALLYGARGYSVARNHRAAEAQADLARGVQLAHQSEEGLALFYTSLWRGFILSTMGDFAQGLDALQAAVRYADARQRPWEEGIAYMLLGLAYNLSGAPEHGYPAALHAYHRLRSAGDPHAIAICVSQLSSLIEATGLGTEIYTAINESLRVSSEQGDQWARAMWLTNMGLAAHRQGDLVTASTHLLESIHLLNNVNELWGSTLTQVRLAAVLLDQGKTQEAETLLHQVIGVTNTAQMLHTKIDAQLTLAQLWLSQGKQAPAAALLTQLRAYPTLSPAQQQRLATLAG